VIAPKALLTVAEVAEHLRISERFARQLLLRGSIASIRIGRRVLIPRAELERIEREGVSP
jgi:excisionase family DNA binding protein